MGVGRMPPKRGERCSESTSWGSSQPNPSLPTWNPVSTARQRFGTEPGGVRKHRDQKGVWDVTSGKDVQFKSYAKGGRGLTFH